MKKILLFVIPLLTGCVYKLNNIDKTLKINQLILISEQLKLDKKWGDAIKSYDEIIKLDSNNVDFYFERGYLKEIALNYGDCIKDFTKVIELDPKKHTARTNRGFAYRKIGQYDKAIKDFSEELIVNPNPYSYEHRAFVKYILQDYEGAVLDVTQSIKLDPNNSIAFKTHALILFKMNRATEACENVTKAIQLNIVNKYPDYAKEIQELLLQCKT